MVTQTGRDDHTGRSPSARTADAATELNETFTEASVGYSDDAPCAIISHPVKSPTFKQTVREIASEHGLDVEFRSDQSAILSP